MSILARLREKDPNAGYAEDFLAILKSLTPTLRQQSQLKIVANSGGMNPPACVRQSAKILVAAGLGDTPIGCVTGDDLLPRLPELMAAGCPLANLDTGQPLAELLKGAVVVSANAYLGARPIADALAGDARIV